MKNGDKKATGKEWAWDIHSLLDNPLSMNRSIKPGWARERVKRVRDLHLNTLYFCVQCGGHVIFQTKTAPMLPGLKHDLMAELVDECRRQKVKLVAYWIMMTNHNQLQVKLHPDWIQRDATGKAGLCLCLNSPYREFLFQQLEDLLKGYEVDGVYYDQLPAVCGCAYCQALFRERFGVPLAVEHPLTDVVKGQKPPVELMEISGGPVRGLGGGLANSTLTPFQTMAAEQMRGFIHGVRSIIDRTRPAAVYIQSKLFGSLARQFGEGVDHHLPEISLGSGPAHRMDFWRTLTAVYCGTGTEDEGKHDVKCDPRARAPSMALVAMASGAVAKRGYMLREFDALYFDPQAEEMQDGLKHLEELSNRLKPFKQLAQVGIVHSAVSESQAANRHNLSCEGLYRMCQEHHLPFKMIPEQDIGREDETGLEALVLPDILRLKPAVQQAIEKFLKEGHGLFVFPYTGTESTNFGGDNPAYAWCGCRYICMRTRSQDGKKPVLEDNHNLGINLQEAGIKDDCWISLSKDGVGEYSSQVAGYVDVELTDGQAIAWRLYDSPETLSELIFTSQIYRPGTPLAPFAVTLDKGGRRTLICGDLAGEMGRTVNGSDFVEKWLVKQMQACVKSKFPIRCVDVPSSVKAMYYQEPGTKNLAVTLANWTVIRAANGYVNSTVPISGMKLEVMWNGRPPKVVDATGRALQVSKNDGALLIEIPPVRICEGIFILDKENPL